MDLTAKPRWFRILVVVAGVMVCVQLYHLPGGRWWGPIGTLAWGVWGLRRSPSRRWLRILWVWWASCVVALVAVWGLTSVQSVQIDMQKQMEKLNYQLASGFRSLQVHQLEILVGKPATSFEGVRYVVGKFHDDKFLDTKSADWIPISTVKELTNVTWYFTRPVSKSYDGENGYLVVVAPSTGEAVGMNLDDVYRHWLQAESHMAGWDAVVDVNRASVSSKLEPGEPPRFHWSLGLNAADTLGPSNHWHTQINTFQDIVNNAPIDRIELTVRGDETVMSGLRQHATWLGMGAIFMASFAGTLLLVGRGVRREQEVAAARSNFTAMVSHELRTPVAALRLHTDMLEHHLISDPEEVENSYRAIGEQTRRLQHLIETVLDLARIERRARAFDLAAGDVNDVVRDAVERLGPDAPKDLTLSLGTNLPPALLDREAATQVLVNLIQNAVRYARDISVVTRADRKWVQVQVLDRGPGIPRKLRNTIFDPYVRASTQGKGVGLGLALVRGYMEGHRGTVAVKPRPGGGTIMTVQFRPVSKFSVVTHKSPRPGAPLELRQKFFEEVSE